jgi:hypothetical protein
MAMIADPVFPSLAAALDPARAAAAFANALAASGHATRHLECSVERSRIKRGRKALIGYWLTGEDSSGVAFDQPAMLALFPRGDASLLPDLSGGHDVVGSKAGPGTLVVTELGAQAWLFPNDRKVHGIARMLAEREGEADIVHYVPEQGCTVRLVEPDGRVLFGKCRADDRGAVAARFGADASGAAGSLRLAGIVSFDPANRILWQEALGGEPLDAAAVLFDPEIWSSRIGPALRELHDMTPPGDLKQLTFRSASETIARRIERTGVALPELAERLQAMTSALVRSVPPEAVPAPSHGDLHPGNLLWDGTSFGLIDLDTAALAPRAFDYATLTAALVHKAIERGAADPASMPWLTHFAVLPAPIRSNLPTLTGRWPPVCWANGFIAARPGSKALPLKRAAA